MNIIKRFFLSPGPASNLAILSLLILLSAGFASAQKQKRNNLTIEEDTAIRDCETIDQRMTVFLKVVERRFLVLNNAAQTEKDARKYGDLPKGSRLQVIQDIERTLDEAINSLDDLASREKENKLLHKGLRALAEGSQKFIPSLQKLLDNSTDEGEKESLISSIEYCNQIIAALPKLPAEEKEKKKPKN